MTSSNEAPTWSRRGALSAAVGAAVAIGSTPAAAGSCDKPLRWHGEELEREFAAYQLAAGAWFAAARSTDLREAASALRGPAAPGGFLWRAKEARWSAVEYRIEQIERTPAQGLPGLVVKARAIELAVFGEAQTRANCTGCPISDQEVGWWPPSRLRAFAAEVVRVSAGAGA